VNFLVIVCDTVRRDHLGCYGGDAGTPHLDAFARESVVFDRAYSGSFPTLPCRAEMFTGRFVFPYLDWGPLPTEHATLSEAMGRARYNCAMVTDNLPLCRDGYGYDRGFHSRVRVRGQWYDPYRALTTQPWPVEESKIGDPKRVQQYLANVADRRAEEDYFAPRTVRAACRWLEDFGTQAPFFLWVDIFDPHEPWDPPKQYLGDDEQHVPWILYPRFGEADRYSPEELAAIRALYRGELRMADHWVGKLLARVEELGLRDDTCVVFLSDHGIFIGEHNLLGKSSKITGDIRGWPTYAEVSQIPMMWRVPGVTPGRRDAFTHPGDVTTTLLELAKADTPSTMLTPSLCPVLTGESDSVREVAVSSWSLRGRRPTRPSVIRDDEWSLVFWASGFPPELYHRASDPGETKNVASEHPAEIKRLHGEYLRFLRMSETPAKNYWPRRWLVSWGQSRDWTGTPQATPAPTVTR